MVLCARARAALATTARIRCATQQHVACLLRAQVNVLSGYAADLLQSLPQRAACHVLRDDNLLVWPQPRSAVAMASKMTNTLVSLTIGREIGTHAQAKPNRFLEERKETRAPLANTHNSAGGEGGREQENSGPVHARPRSLFEAEDGYSDLRARLGVGHLQQRQAEALVAVELAAHLCAVMSSVLETAHGVDFPIL